MTLIPNGGRTINDRLPWELLKEILLLYCIKLHQIKSDHLASVCRYWNYTVATLPPIPSPIPSPTPSPDRKTINTCLHPDVLREIFLYCIESEQIKSGRLAIICRYWRAVVTTLPSIWSTLRVGTWTERERVATWLQRAYPKKVVIDTQIDGQTLSDTLPFAALQDALASTGQWNELTISSFPPENMASQLNFQAAMPMNVLRTLHIVAGCVHTLSFTHLLDLVPTGAPLSELRLHSSFAIAHFLQPNWLPVWRNLTVLIVNGRNIHEPLDLLPAFTQLHTFEVDHLPLPFYELNTNLPLTCTLRKLQLRASSVQWMAGRQFPSLEECAILLPRHWEPIHQHEVQLPSCINFTYHGYPITTVRYFHVPQMRVIDLRSPDCKAQRVYQQLRRLFRSGGRISNLITLHLTIQCSERALSKVLKYLGFLQELNLTISCCSPSWETLLESLVAKPSGSDRPGWGPRVGSLYRWKKSVTWHSNILPHLKYLGIQYPKGFSQPECLYYSPLLILVACTRDELTPPLMYLKVWERSGTTNGIIVVDYTSSRHDFEICGGMVTRHLLIRDPVDRLLQLGSTILFRQLHDLEIDYNHNHEITILPFLEQIKKLDIWHGIIPTYSLNIYLPLVQTLQSLRLCHSTVSWTLGRSFKALREFSVGDPLDTLEIQSRNEALQVDLPACKTLKLWNFSANHLQFLSCPNVHNVQWEQPPVLPIIDAGAQQIFLRTCSRLQELNILIFHHLGRDPLIQFAFCDAREQGVWRDIVSVRVKVAFKGSPRKDRNHFFSQMVGHQRHFDKCWREFTVTNDGSGMIVTVRAAM